MQPLALSRNSSELRESSVNMSIQTKGGTSSRICAAEAALMRWYPSKTLGAIRDLRGALPGWPVVNAKQVAA